MDRYKEIIPDFEKFKEVVKTHQPFDCRVNSLKTSVEEVKQHFKDEGITFEQRDWNKNFLKLDKRPGKTYAHWLGKVYVQESTSAVPPLAFDFSKKDVEKTKVLDMCAAPGSKTTQISGIMENKGEITANDVKSQRTRSLLANIYRLGCLNVKVTEQDARDIKENGGSKKYDKVLVDVPCTAEGNLREKDYLKKGVQVKDSKNMSELQRQILEKAFKLCKKGGEVVYSTCTFSPEENEMVVKDFLDKGMLENPGFSFPHSKGITEWNGQMFSEELRKTVRVYPHQIDSGGIFVAKFTKL